MKLSLTTSGLLDPKRLDSWVPEKRRAIRKAVEAGMKTAGREIADTVRTRMQSAFTVRKAAFLIAAERAEREDLAGQFALLVTAVRGGSSEIKSLVRELKP